MLAIAEEARAIEEGRMDRENNPLKRAPHTVEDLVGDWDRPYSREAACFPPGAFRVDKYWAPVNRVDNARGGRPPPCSRPPRAGTSGAPEKAGPPPGVGGGGGGPTTPHPPRERGDAVRREPHVVEQVLGQLGEILRLAVAARILAPAGDTAGEKVRHLNFLSIWGDAQSDANAGRFIRQRRPRRRTAWPPSPRRAGSSDARTARGPEPARHRPRLAPRGRVLGSRRWRQLPRAPGGIVAGATGGNEGFDA